MLSVYNQTLILRYIILIFFILNIKQTHIIYKYNNLYFSSQSLSLSGLFNLGKRAINLEINLGALQALYNTYKETTNPIPIFERRENSLLRPSNNQETINKTILEESPQASIGFGGAMNKDFFEQNYSRGRKSTKNIKDQIVGFEELNSVQAQSNISRHTKNQDSISKRNIFNKDQDEYTPERSRGASPNISHNSPLINVKNKDDSFVIGKKY